MSNPNRGASEEVLNRLRDESYERMRIELFNSIKQLLIDHDMTWDDLAEKLKWIKHLGDGMGINTVYYNGEEVKNSIGTHVISVRQLNQIAHCFSAEAYIIFRPRFPFTGT